MSELHVGQRVRVIADIDGENAVAIGLEGVISGALGMYWVSPVDMIRGYKVSFFRELLCGGCELICREAEIEPVITGVAPLKRLPMPGERGYWSTLVLFGCAWNAMTALIAHLISAAR